MTVHTLETLADQAVGTLFLDDKTGFVYRLVSTREFNWTGLAVEGDTAPRYIPKGALVMHGDSVFGWGSTSTGVTDEDLAGLDLTVVWTPSA